MKKKMWTKPVAVSLVALLAVATVGCAKDDAKGAAGANADNQTPKFRMFKGPMEPPLPDSNNKYVKYIKEKVGVEPVVETAPWGGGVEYTQKLQTMIASGDLPDVFRPWNGIEQTLVKQGAALALDDLLPKYAPNLWKAYPKEAWDIVKSASPDGKIYYIPSVQVAQERGIIVRKDWLDKVGLTPPSTQAEFVEMLKAFRDKDPNGNGQKDEIPTSGRELGRWFDEVFAMYGVAMFEGYPEWDVYDGKVQYAATTPNMKEALKFANMLYKEKLLDNETFLNKTDVWKSKIQNDTVGVWFHLIGEIPLNWTEQIKKKNPKAEFISIPLPKVDGYKGFLTKKQIVNIEWVILKQNEAKAPAVLKYIDWYYTKEGSDFLNYGLENDTFVMENGAKKFLPEKETAQDKNDRYFALRAANIVSIPEKEIAWGVQYPQMAKAMVEMLKITDQSSKAIAGDGLPGSVYDNFADIKGHKLYQEYMTKIIMGEWPIDKFDEFVDKWNKTGGAEVTKRVNDWYEKTYKK